MRINVGTPDRIARLIVGAVLVLLPVLSGLPLFASPAVFWAAIVVGAVLVATAVFRFCPIYTVLGLSTCKVTPR